MADLRIFIRAAFAAATLALVACGGGGGSGSPVTPPQAVTPTAKIQHVVVIVQENRSFDVLFSGFPGAESASSGLDHEGNNVPLKTITLEDGKNIGHSHQAFVTEFDGGKMDGFDEVPWNSPSQPGGHFDDYPYARVERSEVQPYWDLASKYALGDHMFPTETSGSFTAHLDLIAGTTQIQPSASLVDFPSAEPWGCDAPSGTTTSLLRSDGSVTPDGPFPCLTYPTLAESLDAARVDWRYYAPAVGQDPGGEVWSAFDAVKSVRLGPDWNRNVSSPPTEIFSDLEQGSLPQVSWVIPDYLNSDHPESASNTGPSWVSSVVNAIGASPYWNSTAIIILWDDWGGWYDDLPPPQLDYVGLGMRVPLIVVSPYAKKGYVSHTQYEFGSILKFVEESFGLPSLGTTDARANSISDCFDLTQKVQPFAAIRAPLGRARLLAIPPSHHWVDND